MYLGSVKFTDQGGMHIFEIPLGFAGGVSNTGHGILHGLDEEVMNPWAPLRFDVFNDQKVASESGHASVLLIEDTDCNPNGVCSTSHETCTCINVVCERGQ